ncbi:asparagine synthase (glutamine-hydrolyzing) [Lachnoclostridium sp. Marseille-P6806]|uniref:asparagine synthase (glutamine-hydrolyzing) n=1 Tax=Lachnoclostridium sp. Marseille-P6806 TaxID=2364793 RepID=UPI001031BFF1|nr:asparagine synthase (glutamine-hydrolyzing) [Lachnoclostridium sp. Marseille-P6806]
MCGIAGLIHGGPAAKENIERMKSRMAHRGPDADGSWVSGDGAVALGHRRLAVVDLTETGAQPMLSRSGRYAMVYNGEIYNSAELRAQLLAEGNVSSLRGSSDTEILLESFAAFGIEKTLRACRGMFAVALYDLERRELTLMRDRIGEKPLYYGFAGAVFAFASELGSLALLDGFDGEPDRRVLPFYFARGYIPAPCTIYRNAAKLLPGTTLTLKVTEDGVEGVSRGGAGTGRAVRSVGELSAFVTPYWSLRETAQRGQSNRFRGSFEEASAELERLLRRAVREQSAADVPLGAFLSAGIDSSTITALMQAESTARVRSFTIGMEDREHDEAEAAAQIARQLGTDHTELYITEEDAKAVIPLLPAMFSEPFADSSQIPTYLVSRMTRQHVTVSLSGDAGDELFAGYNAYSWAEGKWRKAKKLPPLLRRPAGAALLRSPLAGKKLWRGRGLQLAARGPLDIHDSAYCSDPFADGLVLSPDGAALPLIPEETPYAALPPDEPGELYHDCMLGDMLLYLPDDILVKVDRTSMAVSLETRVPLLDRDVVEFAWSLPVEFLRGDGTGKRILRNVLYRYVPKELMDRPKKGFSVPVAGWLREPGLREWAEELLVPERLRAEGFLNVSAVRRLWDDFMRNGVWRPQIWYVLMFEEWMRSERGGRQSA